LFVIENYNYINKRADPDAILRISPNSRKQRLLKGALSILSPNAVYEIDPLNMQILRLTPIQEQCE